MEYKLISHDSTWTIQGRKNRDDNWEEYAVINIESRLIFYGDVSEKICQEIEEFLHSKCIHVDSNGYAWKLVD